MGRGALLVIWCICWRIRPNNHWFERGTLAVCSIDKRNLIRNGCRLLEHTANAAIASRREFDSSAHRGGRQRGAGEDVLDLYADKDFRMGVGANAMTAHLVVRHVLAHLAQHGDNVHAGAAEERNEWYFHRAETSILATIIQTGVHRQFVARTRTCCKLHAARELRGRKFLTRHDVRS